MKEQEDIHNELNELSSFLSSMKEKEEGYAVPPDYFNQLTDKVMAQCFPEEGEQAPPEVAEMKPRSQRTVRFLYTRQLWRVAAAVILLAGGWWMWQQYNPTPQDSVALYAALSTDAAHDYIEANISDFDAELLLDNIGDEINFFEDVDLDQEALDNYLNDHIDQLDSDILNELL